MEEARFSIETVSEENYAYVISKLDSQTLYETLKKEVKFQIMIEVLKRFNKDLKECFQNETKN